MLYQAGDAGGNLQVNEFLVVHLQEHTGDLAGQLGLQVGDLGEDGLTQNLLLLWWRRGSNLGLEQRGGTQVTAHLRWWGATTALREALATHVTTAWSAFNRISETGS